MNIWGESLSVMGIGLVMVFLGLIILIAFVYLLAAIFSDHKKAAEAAEAPVSAPAPAPASAPAPAPASAPAPAPAAFAGIDPQVVAVIAAAVAAMDANGKPLVIRSIRRAPGWKRAARAEQVYRF